jgi:HAD superfamily hydrolase (TIGR01509 family)
LGVLGPHRAAFFSVRRAHAASIFNADLSRVDVPLGKLDPALFLLAAKSLDVPPVQCLVVEDAPARAPRGGQTQVGRAPLLPDSVALCLL